MKNFLRSRFYYFIGKNRNSVIVRIIAKISRVIVNAYFSSDFYDMKYNGEELVVKNTSRIYKNNRITIFDVGSNIGEYTILTKKYFPNAAIHCFELFPNNYELLINNKAIPTKNVTFNCSGLSDSTRAINANYFPSNPRTGGINSLEWDKRNKIKKKVIKVKVIRGEEYVKKHNISTINILKIDTEGHDFFVLKGFDALLSAGLIDIVQFEHGRSAIPSRIMLVDFYEYLTHRSYVVGRLHPGGVALKPYDHFDDEYSTTGNYVAIHKSKKDIIACLDITPAPSPGHALGQLSC